MILVRPRAWWFNKVPLSVTLVLLLLDGRRFSVGALVALVLVALTVCAVGNYGYALNELFDVEEDARLGRANAAASAGPRRMWGITALSALCAEVFAGGVAGVPGAIVTALGLCLPLAYSVPPLRIKERKWLGVCADGLAAHVYPAVLALLAVTHWTLRPVTVALAVCVVLWSVAAGLRGILSHQLHTAEQDRGAGLITVVHDFGNPRVEKFIIAVLLPLEVGAFGGALVACDTGPVLWLFVALYLVYEVFKTASGRFGVAAFRPEGQPLCAVRRGELLQSVGTGRSRAGRRPSGSPLPARDPGLRAALSAAPPSGAAPVSRGAGRAAGQVEPGTLPPVPVENPDLGQRRPQPLEETVVPGERLGRDRRVVDAEIPHRGGKHAVLEAQRLDRPDQRSLVVPGDGLAHRPIARRGRDGANVGVQRGIVAAPPPARHAAVHDRHLRIELPPDRQVARTAPASSASRAAPCSRA